MKEVHRKGIDYHTNDHKIHNQNRVEGVIMEVRRKWYLTMVKKMLPRQIWDYGLILVSEVTSKTHSSANSVNGVITLTNVTNKTVDISKYLEFVFYDKVWLKDNACQCPSEPGRWLGISH